MSKSISKQCTAKLKRIVICCDGTWQSATGLDRKTGAVSNVAKLCQILASAGTENGTEYQQVVYYDAGVGTGAIGSVMSAYQGGSGSGLLENVIEAYNFIVNNFTPNDELYFFGFSRGAFTARATAGLVNEIGILRPSAMRRFIQLYSAFVDEGKFGTNDDPFGKTKAWQNFITIEDPDALVVRRKKQKIKVIGVWDTVGALGVPAIGHYWVREHTSSRAQYKFHDVELNENVEHAFQALALDDVRKAFHPSVWKINPSESKALGKAIPELVQCWFPGVHINIGGGNSTSDGEGDRKEQLASISYAWMLDLVRPYLAFDKVELDRQIGDWGSAIGASKPKPPAKDERWMLTKVWSSLVQRQPVDVARGYAEEDIEDSHSVLYDIMGKPKDRIPMNLDENTMEVEVNEAKKGWQSGWRTFESVHHSVDVRKTKREDYVPHAMKGWYYDADLKNWYLPIPNKEPTSQDGEGWVFDEKNKNWYLPGSLKVMPESTLGNGLPDEHSMEHWLVELGKAKNHQ